MTKAPFLMRRTHGAEFNSIAMSGPELYQVLSEWISFGKEHRLTTTREIISDPSYTDEPYVRVTYTVACGIDVVSKASYHSPNGIGTVWSDVKAKTPKGAAVAKLVQDIYDFEKERAVSTLQSVW